MQPKNEPNLAANTPPDYTWHQLGWDVCNFTTVAAVTSAAIVSFQSPMKTVLIHLTKGGEFLPNRSVGTFGFFRAMYAGTFAMVGGSSARTMYVTGTKKNRPTEEIAGESQELEEKKPTTSMSKTGYVMAAALGDIAVTQIPESLSQYKKAGLLPEKFKWYTIHNVRQLMMGGFAARYSAGLVSFGCLCVVEDEIAENLPIANNSTRHFAAGAFSGMIAAGFSYPFAVFKDYALLQNTVNAKGELVTNNSFQVLKSLSSSFMKSPQKNLSEFLINAAKQMPIRAGLTGAIFATISGVGVTLGDEPLKSIIPERFQPSVGKSPLTFFGDTKLVQKEATPIADNTAGFK